MRFPFKTDMFRTDSFITDNLHNWSVMNGVSYERGLL